AWVSLVSIVLTLPWIPGSDWMLTHLGEVNFLAIVTPVLGYAGLALTPREFTMFRRTGWKLIITALLVFTGTFIGSALIAEVLLGPRLYQHPHMTCCAAGVTIFTSTRKRPLKSIAPVRASLIFSVRYPISKFTPAWGVALA